MSSLQGGGDEEAGHGDGYEEAGHSDGDEEAGHDDSDDGAGGSYRATRRRTGQGARRRVKSGQRGATSGAPGAGYGEG